MKTLKSSKFSKIRMITNLAGIGLNLVFVYAGF